ncbi:MAG TPA: PDZ domain-containing protein [Opitutaceae bacterium]|nr:PDZ domain-containing protein [Opitutaceae bacterium]
MSKFILSFAGVALLASALRSESPPLPEEARLMRFPATNGRQIVFSYADQLYTVGMEGGVARRLTNGPGYAVFPRFSPDGSELAFTAQYDGNTEVYLMPAEGGTPRRLTYTATLARDDLGDRMGPNNIVMAWRNTSREVLFRSRMRSFNPFNGQLYSVGTDGDLPRQLPVPRGGFLSLSPDDTKMAYNRVFREFRTWKDYRGGMADDIWIYDFKTGAIENITNNPAQDIIPMWAPNNRIYFLSDRDKRLNLYSYDLASKETTQHTRFTDFDIKFPSLGGGVIVFEEAGYIWSFDIKAGAARRVPIAVRDDLAASRDALINVANFVETASPSPDGKRVVVTARGSTFSVPARDGATRILSRKAGVHERDAVWSPDGKWIAYDSDESGENELYVRAQDGSGDPVQVTRGADTYYYNPLWSPDSRKLLWADRLQRLRYVTVETKAVTLVDTATASEIRQYAWSPDSQWVAWSRPEDNSLDKLWVYSLASGRKFAATDGWYTASAPAFSDDGKFLLFASRRDFKPLLSDIEFDHVYKNLERVYLVALSKETDSPFKPASDEVETAPAPKPQEKAADGRDAKKDAAPGAVVVRVDEDGIRERVIGLPVTAANYSSIRAVAGKVYYLRDDLGGELGTAAAAAPKDRTLLLYSLKDRKETELGRAAAYEITADGKRMLVKVGKEYALIDLPAAKFEVKDKLSLEGLEMHLDRHAEWAQIYNESWRQMRDFFFSPTMNGVDWPAMRAKYAALVPYVQTRYDLTYLVGELIGEIHNSHTYVGDGDRPLAPRIATGLLGAELSRDPASRAYRIDRIIHGENWQDATRSPLTDIGVSVAEGDYILAVDGRSVRELSNIYSALVGTAGKQVVLRVNSRPVDDGARSVTVVPIADEAPLYYESWVRRNTDYVSRMTDARVGYIHIPDMGAEGLGEFARHFYPQLTKAALIVDVRGDGGGNVSPMIIERLARELVLVQKARNGTPRTNPRDMELGPKVVLMDEFSASDGDIFPYRFRIDGLGKLIGKRSWGGVVGFRASLPIVDGGYLDKPEFAPYSKDGRDWPVEDHGVDPDIVVDNDPAKEFAGVDQQLDRAIEEVLLELKTRGGPLPPPPPWPDRS